MCLLDDADGMVTMLGEGTHVARIAHRCKECGRVIGPGETYARDRFVWEGEMHCHKTCSHCAVLRRWLQDECGGYLYSSVMEDFIEHEPQTWAQARVHVAARNCWRRRDGSLRPVPPKPPTTHERTRTT